MYKIISLTTRTLMRVLLKWEIYFYDIHNFHGI